MDNVIKRLKQKLNVHSAKALHETLDRLTAIQTNANPVASWTSVRALFEDLENRGLWDTAGDDAKLLAALQNTLVNPGVALTIDGNSRTSNVNSAQTAGDTPNTHKPQTRSNIHPLDQDLSEAQFLHRLATEPAKLLPPGKSLSSALSRPRTARKSDDATERLQERVAEAAHKAFWDEALESLSDPTSSKQITRAQLLYGDLLTAVKPLLPEGHPVLVTLGDPLSPTSSPLLSVLRHLHEVLRALRRRCAPIRDEEIDVLLERMDGSPPLSSDVPASAKRVIEVIRGILRVSGSMRDDLSQAIIGIADEKQLSAFVRSEARSRESELLLQLWTQEQLQSEWSMWVGNTELVHGFTPSVVRSHLWASRLVRALGQNEAVGCRIPGVASASLLTGNLLPPIFLFCRESLVRIQNWLQALVICATLRSLIHVPPPTAPTTTSTAVPDEELGFMERVWALLRAELEEGGEDYGETRVVNLADEVVRAQRMAMGSNASLDQATEVRLRAAVDRTLKPQDPVFILLMKRLLEALSTRLSESEELRRGDASTPNIPERMQTGAERVRKRPRLNLDLPQEDEMFGWEDEPPLSVKGFTDRVVSTGVEDVLRDIRLNMAWVEQIWQTILQDV